MKIGQIFIEGFYTKKSLTSSQGFVRTNPALTEQSIEITMCGNNSVVECNLAKVDVASSNLVSRSILYERPDLVDQAFIV